jgi:hypothetical protein
LQGPHSMVRRERINVPSYIKYKDISKYSP